jgi:hypothetical protein
MGPSEDRGMIGSEARWVPRLTEDGEPGNPAKGLKSVMVRTQQRRSSANEKQK